MTKQAIEAHLSGKAPEQAEANQAGPEAVNNVYNGPNNDELEVEVRPIIQVTEEQKEVDIDGDHLQQHAPRNDHNGDGLQQEEEEKEETLGDVGAEDDIILEIPTGVNNNNNNNNQMHMNINTLGARVSLDRLEGL